MQPFRSISLPVTPWGDFLGVEKVTKDTFRRRGLRFPRLLKTSTLEPPKRNRARFPSYNEVTVLRAKVHEPTCCFISQMR